MVKAKPHAPLKDGIMLAWQRECYRSTTTASVFGAELTLLWPEFSQSRIGKLARYFVSFWRTFLHVLKRKPSVTIVMNLPSFAPLAVLLASFLVRSKVVLDFHSGALTDKFWSKFTPLYKYIAKRAPFVICHNLFDGAEVESWGGKPFYLIALPRNFDGVPISPPPVQPSVLVVCSFRADEPINLLIETMKQCPNVNFEVTGSFRKAGLVPSDMPKNISLLGFIDYADYIEKMSLSTAIITLSDRSHIMQAAVHEAISLGVPVIANKSNTLESVLGTAGLMEMPLIC